jgi:hypothetical protein
MIILLWMYKIFKYQDFFCMICIYTQVHDDVIT